ncbi:tRNA pseudouridine(38-40) synthase TruA [Pseudotenacibaculum sp. MALMAid0570]|uniref:tRNA pseudouridine(38-40) synthase TruA n=1 Tax=Pseudotenacibaculum sp. MALMAid0570 TaxID=3143938 RepID=UPI0032E0001E
MYMNYEHSYLIEIQYLGFRFHGWQKQTNSMSLHEMIDKTLSFSLKNIPFKSIGMSRTDSKVSANQYYFQIFLNDILDDAFLEVFNQNAPQDLRVKRIQKVTVNFNIIQANKIKEYHYYFSLEKNNHPFAASLMTAFEDLDIEKMKIAAIKFKGKHHFHKYCTKPSPNTRFERIIEECEIVKNNLLDASFFPDLSFIFKVKGKGFLRYQIRLMMAMLVEIGAGRKTLEQLIQSISFENDRKPLKNIAPASGLQLYAVEFDDLNKYLL